MRKAYFQGTDPMLLGRAKRRIDQGNYLPAGDINLTQSICQFKPNLVVIQEITRLRCRTIVERDRIGIVGQQGPVLV